MVCILWGFPEVQHHNITTSAKHRQGKLKLAKKRNKLIAEALVVYNEQEHPWGEIHLTDHVYHVNVFTALLKAGSLSWCRWRNEYQLSDRRGMTDLVPFILSVWRRKGSQVRQLLSISHLGSTNEIAGNQNHTTNYLGLPLHECVLTDLLLYFQFIASVHGASNPDQIPQPGGKITGLYAPGNREAIFLRRNLCESPDSLQRLRLCHCLEASPKRGWFH